MAHPKVKGVGWLLLQTARLHRFHLNEQLVDKGLYAGQEQVLRALAITDSLSVTELAEMLRVKAPTISKSLTRLTELGFIRRFAVPGDLRAVRVKLTSKGRSLVEAVEASWKKAEDDLLRDFDEKDRRRLRKLLRRAGDNLAHVVHHSHR